MSEINSGYRPIQVSSGIIIMLLSVIPIRINSEQQKEQKTQL